MSRPQWLQLIHEAVKPYREGGRTVRPVVNNAMQDRLLEHIDQLHSLVTELAKRVDDLPGMCAAYDCDYDGHRHSCSMTAHMEPCPALAARAISLLCGDSNEPA